ncbi:MAG: hypothetical protein CJBNEKGG_02274 [Prosthecobacter sp.]|nr:hypothetical protein [Prosthecobacter sp.]
MLPALLLSLTGLVLMYFDRTRLILALRSYFWKPTRAVVTDLENTSFVLDGVGRSGPQVTHFRELTYSFQYHVHGVEHRTQNYCFGGHMDQASANYHVGDETILYVDPRHPEQAVVRRGIMPSQLIAPGLVLAGAIVFILGRS